MNIIKLMFFIIISMSASICFASVSNEIDLKQYLSYKNKYLNGVGGADLQITDTSDVFEYYTNDFNISQKTLRISYDLDYMADPSTIDPTYDLLAFRIFPQGQWVTHWGATERDVARLYFVPRIDIIKSIVIDLAPFQGFDMAMGWAFVSDVPSQAHIVISNIRIEVIDEPGTLALLGIGLLAGLFFIRKYPSQEVGCTPRPIAYWRHGKTRPPECLAPSA